MSRDRLVLLLRIHSFQPDSLAHAPSLVLSFTTASASPACGLFYCGDRVKFAVSPLLLAAARRSLLMTFFRPRSLLDLSKSAWPPPLSRLKRRR